jgi:hypothetical protein
VLPLPSHLQGVFFEFIWDTQKVWQLPTAPSLVPLSELAWLLDLTVWTTVPREPRFDLAPSTVLAHPERFSARWQRIQSVDLSFALEMFRNANGQWVILDGYHRLAKHHLSRSINVPVRLHSDECKIAILADGR